MLETLGFVLLVGLILGFLCGSRAEERWRVQEELREERLRVLLRGENIPPDA